MTLGNGGFKPRARQISDLECIFELTRENAAIKDVERYDGSVLGRGEEARMIVNTKVMLKPHNRRGTFFNRCQRQTTSTSVPTMIGGEMIPPEMVREEMREMERRHENGGRPESVD